jgi:cystathionine beta-lyase/cystathionine gamma-synthase
MKYKSNHTIANDYETMEDFLNDCENINTGKSPNTYWDTYENGARRKLEAKLARLYGSRESLFVNSGMNAIHVAIESNNLKTGDKILIGQKCYFETTDWIQKYLVPRGVVVLKVDTSNSSKVLEMLETHKPNICFLETVINSPEVICLDFDGQFFEASQGTAFIIDNTVQSHLTKWYKIVPAKYHDKLLIVESGSKYITENLMMGVVYGTSKKLSACRDYARCVGSQLQQKAFEHIQPSDFVNLDKKLERQSQNVKLFLKHINKLSFEHVKSLDDQSNTYNQQNIFKNGTGCLVFMKLESSTNVQSDHRKIVNTLKHNLRRKKITVDIRAGFGYATTCLRTYEDNSLNQPDRPLYIRISIGIESSTQIIQMANSLNKIVSNIMKNSTPNLVNHTKNGNLTGSALAYIDAVRPMSNEQNIILAICNELEFFIDHFSKKSHSKIQSLYYCCGPAPFLYNLKMISTLLENKIQNDLLITGVDLNPDFISYNKLAYPNHVWKVADAVKYKKANKISLLNSSYHHIPPDQKLAFLQNICDNLEQDGIIIMGENFLPYYKDNLEREKSVLRYYTELIKYLEMSKAKLNILEKLKLEVSIELLNQAMAHDLELDGEFKNHIWECIEQIESSGLKVKKIIQVWPKKNIFEIGSLLEFKDVFAKNFYGSFVLILQKL